MDREIEAQLGLQRQRDLEAKRAAEIRRLYWVVSFAKQLLGPSGLAVSVETADRLRAELDLALNTERTAT